MHDEAEDESLRIQVASAPPAPPLTQGVGWSGRDRRVSKWWKKVRLRWPVMAPPMHDVQREDGAAHFFQKLRK